MQARYTHAVETEGPVRVAAGDVNLAVEDHGEGLPVMLLHGFPLSAQIWLPLRTALEEAARLITPDLRGFGSSEKPAGSYGMDVLAADVVALADALGIERFVLGGHSMGGYVALRIAAMWPQRLLGLILVDSKAEADGPAARARRDAAIARIEAGEGRAFRDEFVAGLVAPDTLTRSPRQLEEMRMLAAEIPDHVLVGCLAGIRDRSDSSAVLARITVPALVIVGEQDALMPPAGAQKLAAALPAGELAVIPGAGHVPSVERPVAAAEAMLAFLRRNFPSARRPAKGRTAPAPRN